MTTRRHMQDPPDAWAPSILTLLELTRTAATPATSTPHPGALPARLVSAWLTHNRGPQLVATTARLCTFVLEQPGVDVDDLAAAWDATHGHRLIRGSPA